jgi:hypothetical protein
MEHVDIVGTETYLNTTPELLDLAGKRLHPPIHEDQSRE